MKNKIKMGVVEVDGICIGDIIENEEGVVVGFRKVDGVWFADMGEDGEECFGSVLLSGVVG